MIISYNHIVRKGKSQENKNMSRKTVVIVGTGKGMGNHIAEKFAQNDFRVVLMARNESSLADYIKEFESKGMEAYGFTADAADTESLTDAFKKVKEQFGVVDVLVYNACILTGAYPTELNSEVLMEHYQVDVASALHCAKLVVPDQKASGKGTILFTGGGLATYPMAEFTCVSVDKAALKALAITLNQELQPQNIFVGVVTIMGNVAPETHYSPELIAEEYWGLYTNRKECEVIYK